MSAPCADDNEREEEPVTIKKLPGGPEVAGWVHSRQGRRMELAPRSDDPLALAQFPMGALVEIVSPARVYLGEIKGSANRRLVAHIEHALDAPQLARIAQIWQPES